MSEGLKIWLDDVRPAPDGWLRFIGPLQVIETLALGGVTHMSLDHDLGDDERVGTGYDVLVWLEEQLARGLFAPEAVPNISIHTANPVARQRMEAALRSIGRLVSKGVEGCT